MSIDIADVDVGRNIGAQLQMDQAEADKRIARANAEERRAMAVATEQEMKAHTQEMRAKVVEAEAEVPVQWRKRSAADVWASWTTTTCKTYRRTPQCAMQFPAAAKAAKAVKNR